MPRIIIYSLYLLAALIPLTFTDFTTELFEFPKFLILLTFTLTIAIAWGAHIFLTHDYSLNDAKSKSASHHLLHTSILLILATQLIATLFSLHPYTSFWGYYSRVHQGLITTICYTIIYFAAVKWLDKNSTRNLLFITISTSILVSLIAILEHHNISFTCLLMTLIHRMGNGEHKLIFDTSCWGNNTSPLARSFATIGQPNWLAAYLIPNLLLALFYYRAFYKKSKFHHYLPPITISLFTLATIYSNSRSGMLALTLSLLAYILIQLKNNGISKLVEYLSQYLLPLIAVVMLVGSPFTKPIYHYLTRSDIPVEIETTPQGTVLETGGTESGDIRKIVWSGALELIEKHLLLGTGPETFAYTYYWERPVMHNYTSEWEFLYNKAHNEYLNIAATSGLVGVAGYLLFHYALLLTSLTKPKLSDKKSTLRDDEVQREYYPVLAGTLVSFGVTNFFGFSVTSVYFAVIIVAALVSTLTKAKIYFEQKKQSTRLAIYAVIAISLSIPIRILQADLAYVKGRAKKDVSSLEKAIGLRGSEALYHSELGELYASLSTGDDEYRALAIREAELTKNLNPYHLNYAKSRAKIYITLASDDPNYYVQAASELLRARELAPTDPKLAYNLALIYSRLGNIEAAEAEMNQAIELKKDYQDAYYALALIYQETKQVDKIPPLLDNARYNLATYSGLLNELMERYK